MKRTIYYSFLMCLLSFNAFSIVLAGELNKQSTLDYKTFTEHTDKVNTVTFQSNGILASASQDRTIKFWDFHSNKVRTTQENNAVKIITYSPNQKFLASTSQNIYDKGMHIRDLSSGDVKTLFGKNKIGPIAFLPDNKSIASVHYKTMFSYEKDIKIWGIATGNIVNTLQGHTDEVLALAVSPIGNTLASASKDGTVKIWDTASQKEQQTLKGHSHWVYSISFSPNGELLASASNDRTIKVWDVSSGMEIATLQNDLPVTLVAFSPDGRTLASASDCSTIKLWDIPLQKKIATLYGHTHIVSTLSFSPNGELLASGSWDKTVKLWDVQNIAR